MAEMLLCEVRKFAGKSQRELAETLGVKQPSIARMEQQDDMQLSTLQKIVEALGGKLEIVAHFPMANVRIGQFNQSHRRPRRKKRELQPV
jgi:predicted transcriptional regulator